MAHAQPKSVGHVNASRSVRCNAAADPIYMSRSRARMVMQSEVVLAFLGASSPALKKHYLNDLATALGPAKTDADPDKMVHVEMYFPHTQHALSIVHNGQVCCLCVASPFVLPCLTPVLFPGLVAPQKLQQDWVDVQVHPRHRPPAGENRALRQECSW